MSNCPKCGSRMATTNSRKIGTMIDRRRMCKCGHVDRALVRPAEVVKVLPVERKRTTRRATGT